jgi:iron(III) transport system substrate-binding protein
LAALAQAPHPNAAKLLMNYKASVAGQTLYNQGTASSVLPGISGTVPLPADYEAPQYAKAAAEQGRLLSDLGL